MGAGCTIHRLSGNRRISRPSPTHRRPTRSRGPLPHPFYPGAGSTNASVGSASSLVRGADPLDHMGYRDVSLSHSRRRRQPRRSTLPVRHGPAQQRHFFSARTCDGSDHRLFRELIPPVESGRPGRASALAARRPGVPLDHRITGRLAGRAPRRPRALVDPLTPLHFIYNVLSNSRPLMVLSSSMGASIPAKPSLALPARRRPGNAPDDPVGPALRHFPRDRRDLRRLLDLLDGTSGAEVLTSAGALGTLPSLAEPIPARPNLELVRAGENPHFHAALVRPRVFERERKYPVILSVYAGPGATMVQARARAYLTDQWVADQATSWFGSTAAAPRSRARPGTHLRGNLIDVASKSDRRAAASRPALPGLDLERVGVTGWLFGGYFSAMATIRRPDFRLRRGGSTCHRLGEF